MSWYYLLVFFFVTNAFASDYDKCVKEMANHHIQLSDDSLWEIVGLEENKKQWQIGDPITLEVPLFTSQFFLTNLRVHNSLPVDFKHNQQPSLLTHQIETISADGRRLRLDDQSIWSVGFFDSWTSENWKKENRLLKIRAADLEGFYFINLDQLDENPFIYAHFSFKQEQPYRHFITDIGKLDDHIFIKLNCGFKFDVQTYLFSKPDDKILATWHKGDEVNLYCNVWETEDHETGQTDRHMDIDLINLRTLEETAVKFDEPQEEWHSPKIVRKDVVSYGEYFLLLDDSTFWKITDRDYHVNRWQVGDRLLISANIFRGSQGNPYCLLNPDHGLLLTSWGRTCYLYSAAQGKTIKMNETVTLREE